MNPSTLDQLQLRHRRELRDLQGRITNKKKNATKKTRRGVNDECAELERQLRDRHAAEISALTGQEASLDDIGPEDDTDEAACDKTEDGPEQVQDSGSTTVEAPRKRNRQKERLARRAAEREAAAQTAHDEAAGMTDRRAHEGEAMRESFAAHGLVEKEVQPDGHCLFSAVADQLVHNDVPRGEGGEEAQVSYKVVRAAAATYMLENRDDFAPFLEEDVDVYATRVRDTAEWGGQLELMALARRYGVEIRVVQDGRTERIGEEEGKASGKVLWLAYYRHGYGLGEHYNSLRRKKS